MTEFNEFKKKVCNFYRNNDHLYYILDINPHWQDSDIEVEFREDNTKVIFVYKVDGNDKQYRDRKAVRLMKELGKDLKGIEHELHI